MACYDHDGQVSAVRFIPQANVLASVGIDGALWPFSPIAGAEPAACLLRPGNRARTCAFTRNGTPPPGRRPGTAACPSGRWSPDSGLAT